MRCPPISDVAVLACPSPQPTANPSADSLPDYRVLASSHRTDLLEATRQLVHTSTPLLKTLLSYPVPASSPQRKTLQQKLSREYQASLAAFQKIQRVAAEKQRTFVEVKKREVRAEQSEQSDHQLVELEEQGLLQSQQQEQAQQQVS